MANYCTINDVNALVPQSPFTAQTVPNQTQVEAFIASVSLRIDATLNNIGYVTPVVSGPKAVALLREACAWAVLGLSSQARLTAVAPDQSMGTSVWTKMYDRWIDELASNRNPFELPDAPRTGLAVIKPIGEAQADSTRNSIDSGQASDPYDYLTNPVFRMGMKF